MEGVVENLGRLGHEEIKELYEKANIFLYPTEFAEIDCISARKAQCGGAIPITTDFAALDETVQYGYKYHSSKDKDSWAKPYQFDFALKDEEGLEQLAQQVIKELRNKTPRDEMQQWTKQFDWNNIAERWLNYLR